MNPLKRFVTAAVVAILVVAFAPTLKAAGESEWPSVMTIDKTVQVGSLVLDQGQYLLQKLSNSPNRNVVMIYSMDRRRWEGAVLGLPKDKSKTSGRFVFASREGVRGEQETLQYWFHPGWNRGIQFQ